MMPAPAPRLSAWPLQQLAGRRVLDVLICAKINSKCEYKITTAHNSNVCGNHLSQLALFEIPSAAGGWRGPGPGMGGRGAKNGFDSLSA